jgi:uncharacterized protein (TIGR02284 family)
MAKDAAIEILNELIQTSEDGERGFAEAAEIAENPELQTLLSRCADECRAAVQELQSQVTALGGEPQQSGSVAGTAHRSWIKAKAAVEDKDIAVLEEVERGEDYAKAVYSKALRTELPADVKSLVQKQYDGTLQHHDLFRDLRDGYKNKASSTPTKKGRKGKR